MSARGTRGLLCALVLVLGVQLAPTCGGPTAPAVAAVGVEFADAFSISQGYLLKVNAFVSAESPYQAYDIELHWDPAVLEALPAVLVPHSDFDDDGALFAPLLHDPQAGTLAQIVDLRHGGPGASGKRRVVTAWFYAPNGGQVAVRATGTVAAGDGTPFTVVAADPLIYPAP